jgi:hypothetical protein
MASELNRGGELVAEALAWMAYVGFFAGITGIALYFEVEPLRSLQRAFATPWHGTVAALAAGVAVLLGARWVFSAAKSGKERPSTGTEPSEPSETKPAEPEAGPGRRRKRKKKKKGGRR